jgi:hypothetical protein
MTLGLWAVYYLGSTLSRYLSRTHELTNWPEVLEHLGQIVEHKSKFSLLFRFGQMCANYPCEFDHTLVSYLSST